MSVPSVPAFDPRSAALAQVLPSRVTRPRRCAPCQAVRGGDAAADAQGHARHRAAQQLHFERCRAHVPGDERPAARAEPRRRPRSAWANCSRASTAAAPGKDHRGRRDGRFARGGRRSRVGERIGWRRGRGGHLACRGAASADELPAARQMAAEAGAPVEEKGFFAALGGADDTAEPLVPLEEDEAKPLLAPGGA